MTPFNDPQTQGLMLHPRYQGWQGGNGVDKYKQLINGFLVHIIYIHIIYIYILYHTYIYIHTRIYRQREREKELSACAVRACVRRYVCGCVGVCVCVIPSATCGICRVVFRHIPPQSFQPSIKWDQIGIPRAKKPGTTRPTTGTQSSQPQRNWINFLPSGNHKWVMFHCHIRG